jgi:hypothetical protein
VNTGWLAALLALGLSAGASEARAEAQAVALVVPDCLGTLGDDVKRLVALELSPRLRVIEKGPGSDVLTASVRCPAQGPLELIVDDPERATALRSELDLARTAPRARTRLLALSLAELIATSKLEQPARARVPEPEPPKPPKPDAEQAELDSDTDTELETDAARQASWFVWLGPGFSFFGAPKTPLFGADVGGAYRLGPLSLQAELAARWGEATFVDAEVALQSFSAALALAPVLELGSLELQLGAGLRAGYAKLEASPRRANLKAGAVDGAWLGPLLSAALQLDAWGPSGLRVGIEGGYTTLSVVGNDAGEDELMALRGLWVSAVVGLGLRWR